MMALQNRRATVILVLCALLIQQSDCASLSYMASRAAVRLPRMTPFWRGLSLRPIGASCRDATECFTRLCSNNRCALRTFTD